MTDLLSRADAIEAVMRHKMPFTIQQEVAREIDALPSADVVSREMYEKRTQTDERIIDSYRREFSEAASAEAAQGWIPCSETLPEIDETLRPCDQISDEVLGTDTYGNIRHVYLTNCGYLKPTFCTVEEGMSVDIVAWMPLPTQYKGGGSE